MLYIFEKQDNLPNQNIEDLPPDTTTSLRKTSTLKKHEVIASLSIHNDNEKTVLHAITTAYLKSGRPRCRKPVTPHRK
ncbi:hypothetical protein ALQ95_102579 [Pseudomonas syringae pv. ribicola]|uniref:Uncharacterized protein n=1 Tax=Pseudomonas syringae pv. ribicola TaxID=55398 RepID=A0A3M2VHJ5_PSESI|nr:hypothetical protein ALQ95_102579 [Pseudomonas syringae pv. ribicola]